MRVSDLPIEALRVPLRHALGAAAQVILQAPTGSGKSTQVPQMLLDEGLCGGKKVVVLQPRRLATRLLARHVAQERNGRLGDEVGYQIRFEKCLSRDTRILFVTEGLLLRRMLDDPRLEDIGAIVFDEFHERHLTTDVSLALAAQVQAQRRPDLKLLVMSATLDSQGLNAYFPQAKILQSEGRTFPVEMRYLGRDLPAEAPVWEQAAAAFRKLSQEGQGGDCLVFMPGAYEISRTVEAISQTPEGRKCRVMPLHGELSAEQQDAAIERYPQQKVVVSTNVAETSLTIDGVRIVIDSGLARIARYDARRGINTLFIEKISRASADQRAGRAGRTSAGLCQRLWTEADHSRRPAHETPEIHRVDLSETLLLLKQIEAVA